MKQCKQHLVSGILIKDKSVLLGLRKNTTDFAGFWSVPVGHLEGNETELDGLKREIKEELGIALTTAQKMMVKKDCELKIINAFYRVEQWSGNIENREPELCEQLEWFRLDFLPEKLTPVCKQVLRELTQEII